MFGQTNVWATDFFLINARDQGARDEIDTRAKDDHKYGVVIIIIDSSSNEWGDPSAVHAAFQLSENKDQPLTLVLLTNGMGMSVDINSAR